MNCSESQRTAPCSELPGHPVYTGASQPDPQFDDTELPYRRFMRDHYLEGELVPAHFRFPNPSFNREKYSSPEDVLHPDCADGRDVRGWGVLECSSKDIPTPFTAPDGRQYNFSAIHCPPPCCYAHAELLCLSGGGYVKEPSKKVREAFRVELARKMRVRIEPQV